MKSNSLSRKNKRNNNPLISIIIPTYNRKDELINCITSLFNQSYNNFEIIIIDDCSIDGTAKLLSTNFPAVKVIKNRNRYGPSLSRNLGIKKSKGSLILFIDSDIEFHSKHTLRNMVNTIQTYPDIGSVGGEIPTYIDKTRFAYGRLFNRDGKKTVKVSENYTKDGKNFRQCDYLATCNCMVRTDIAYKIGGFDPYYVFGAEDMDFGHAIKRLGYKTVVGYDYAILHHHSKVGRFRNIGIIFHRTGLRFIIKKYGLSSFFLRTLYDAGYFILIYLTLIPKILIYVLMRKNLVIDHFLYGIKMIYSYWWNLIHLKETISCRGKNFLDSKEISNVLNEIPKRMEK